MYAYFNILNFFFPFYPTSFVSKRRVSEEELMFEMRLYSSCEFEEGLQSVMKMTLVSKQWLELLLLPEAAIVWKCGFCVLTQATPPADATPDELRRIVARMLSERVVLKPFLYQYDSAVRSGVNYEQIYLSNPRAVSLTTSERLLQPIICEERYWRQGDPVLRFADKYLGIYSIFDLTLQNKYRQTFLSTAIFRKSTVLVHEIFRMLSNDERSFNLLKSTEEIIAAPVEDAVLPILICRLPEEPHMKTKLDKTFVILKWFIQKRGYPTSSNLLIQLARSSKLTQIKDLFSFICKKVLPRLKYQYHQRDRFGRSAFYKLIVEEVTTDRDIWVNHLIEKGVDISNIDVFGSTVLHYYVKKRGRSICPFLKLPHEPLQKMLQTRNRRNLLPIDIFLNIKWKVFETKAIESFLSLLVESASAETLTLYKEANIDQRIISQFSQLILDYSRYVKIIRNM